MAIGELSLLTPGPDPYTLEEAAAIVRLSPEELIACSAESSEIRLCVRVPRNISVVGLHPDFLKLARDELIGAERDSLEACLLETKVWSVEGASFLYPFTKDIMSLLRLEEEHVSLFRDAACSGEGDEVRRMARPWVTDIPRPEGGFSLISGIYSTFPTASFSRIGKRWMINNQVPIRISKKNLFVAKIDLTSFLHRQEQDVSRRVKLLDGYQQTNCDRLEYMWSASLDCWGASKNSQLTIGDIDKRVAEYLTGRDRKFSLPWAEMASKLIHPRYARGIGKKQIPRRVGDFVSDELKVITSVCLVAWGDEAYKSDGPYYTKDEVANFLMDRFGFSKPMAQYSAMIIRPDEGVPEGSGPRPKARKPKKDIEQKWKEIVGELPTFGS